MFDFMLRGGFLMYPILGCSVISVTIILERLFSFYCARIRIPNLSVRVKNLIKEGKSSEAIMLCERINDPVSHVLAVGIHIKRRNKEEQEKMILRAGSKIIRQLQTNLRGLAIIGNITPLLGLLGTVTGMIKAFIKIQELGGKVDASVLAGGIWEALITTAAGLSVAIPTLVAYHYFESRVDNVSAQLKDAAGELLEIDLNQERG